MCSACLLLVSCSKQNAELSKVEALIEALKEGNWETIKAPDFSDYSIAELLEFRNDKSQISSFPSNPISSFYMEEVSLGMYVLWTIGSIRMRTIEDPDFYLFASLNPRIVRGSTGELVDQEVVFPEVSAAYFAWWNSSLSTDAKLQINPLEQLDLIWN
ncbi:MAG: DUF4943 family protein [Saprospiraceae bacterium]|nr:DUF4943 family protein [Saprospiraceae bacterium]